MSLDWHRAKCNTICSILDFVNALVFLRISYVSVYVWRWLCLMWSLKGVCMGRLEWMACVVHVCIIWFAINRHWFVEWCHFYFLTFNSLVCVDCSLHSKHLLLFLMMQRATSLLRSNLYFIGFWATHKASYFWGDLFCVNIFTYAALWLCYLFHMYS